MQWCNVQCHTVFWFRVKNKYTTSHLTRTKCCSLNFGMNEEIEFQLTEQRKGNREKTKKISGSRELTQFLVGMLSNCMRRSKCWAANVCTTINQPWCSGNKNDWIIHTRKRKEYASYYYLVKDSLNFMIYENSMHFTGGRSEMANLKYRYGRLICLPVLGSKVHAFWAVIQ